ncbi:hypothetical protein CO172_01100 [Candidatus Uhrbacteria bacterium CG_4_9_14_3_um_filter_36_7]|uniref:HD domain-containing protein n=1 Tax=Candidatus Uhrbacteria bacterium CG_4_9_14_3_um_filter_36_7 TaxID=1975033 RepID=A0A2M7XHW6_9BACT|nr:MAG: hypothetical protein CO172_01100 [Candidatus Uhrbacteria bacterium CG_4_9_14_3_um_filter_36_7]
MWRYEFYSENRETIFLDELMVKTKEDILLQKKAQETLDQFLSVPQMRSLYEIPQTPVFHAEGPFVKDHLKLMLVSLFAILEGKIILRDIEELARLKGFEGEIEEMQETICEQAATLECFILCHDLGKALTISFKARPGSDGDSLGFQSPWVDLWHPSCKNSKQQMLLKKYQELYQKFADERPQLHPMDCQAEFFSAYQIDIHYHGHAHAIFHPNFVSTISQVTESRRLSSQKCDELMSLIALHLEPLYQFESKVNTNTFEHLVSYAKKHGHDADDFLDLLQAAVLLDAVFGSMRRDAHRSWHESSVITYFLRSEYLTIPGKQEERIHLREQKQKERLQERFRFFELDGNSIMSLLKMSPGVSFGTVLHQIQDAAIGKGTLPDLSDDVRREIERRITLFRFTK